MTASSYGASEKSLLRARMKDLSYVYLDMIVEKPIKEALKERCYVEEFEINGNWTRAVFAVCGRVNINGVSVRLVGECDGVRFEDSPLAEKGSGWFPLRRVIPNEREFWIVPLLYFDETIFRFNQRDDDRKKDFHETLWFGEAANGDIKPITHADYVVKLAALTGVP
jgi:hypothetical protein